MQLPETTPKYLHTHALVVVASREVGCLYRIADGHMELIDTLTQHLQPLSDNEGFFFSGIHGGGSPKDRDDTVEYLKLLRRKIGHELKQLIAKEPVSVIYIFEPEHLKGRVAAEIDAPKDTTIHHVRYGNYVDTEPRQIVDMITEYIEEHKIDLDSHEYEKDFAKF